MPIPSMISSIETLVYASLKKELQLLRLKRERERERKREERNTLISLINVLGQLMLYIFLK